MALVAVGVVTAWETVPYTGRSQLQFMSPQQESELGAQAYQQTLAKTKLSATVQAVASLLGTGATVGVLLPWSRAQESEADHLGLILMAKAGYDPHATRDLWVR
jgi:predicted Zn-dependent protease